MEFQEIILRLLVAHFIADFFIQPSWMVESKMKRSLRSGALYLHVAIHAALYFILLWSFEDWLLILLISVSHLIIDIIKIELSKTHPKHGAWWFAGDQLLHLTSIAVISALLLKFELADSLLDIQLNWVLILGLTFVTMPAAYVVKGLMLRFPLPDTESTLGLQNAGLYIGILERLLTFVFILSGHWEAVGFLIAAKSIFRFGDLREQKDIRLTEYILIGTFLSFGVAILTALVVQYFL
jgi:hypothetical protein